MQVPSKPCMNTQEHTTKGNTNTHTHQKQKHGHRHTSLQSCVAIRFSRVHACADSYERHTYLGVCSCVSVSVPTQACIHHAYIFYVFSTQASKHTVHVCLLVCEYSLSLSLSLCVCVCVCVCQCCLGGVGGHFG